MLVVFARASAARARRLVLAGLAALATPALAQPAPAQPSAPLTTHTATPQRLAFERIAQERGLSNGTVTSIAQDRAGFLWLGTEDGLNRYDGATFSLFRPIPGDSTSLGNAWVTRVVVGRDGALWVATLRAGLHRFDPHTERFRRFRHDGRDSRTLSSNEVNVAAEARDGTMWVGTSRGLDRFDPATGLVRRHVLPDLGGSMSRHVLAVAEDDHGTVWVGTRAGILRSDTAGTAFTHLAATGYAPVRALLTDRRGTLWIGTEAELVALDPVTGVVRARHAPATAARPSPFAGRVLTLAEAPDGMLWVGSDSGATALDPRTGSYVRHVPDARDPRSLAGAIVRALLVDRGGVLWVGTESRGLNKHAPSTVPFATLGTERGASSPALSDGYVRGIAHDRAGDLWVATQFGGLNRLDERTGELTVYRHRVGDPRSLPGDNVWGTLEDRTGTFWVGLHRHGLGTLDRETGAFTPFPGVPHDASVNVLYEDRAGRLLVGLESVGLIEISADRRRMRRFGPTIGGVPGLATDDVQSILEDRQGILWVGGDGGLTRLDRRTGHVTRYRAATGMPGALSASFVTNIVEDSRGTLWVATKGGGLNRLDRHTGRFTTLGPADGLPHSFVYGVLEDGRGRLWVSTDDGLAMLDPATGAIASFGLEDGLQAREFNRRAHYRSPTGTMYFGGINGVNVFNPDVAAAAPPPPPVSLVSLVPSGGAPIYLPGFPPDSALTLRHDQNAFTVSFAALDFTAPSKTRYAYRLEGVDREWTAAGTRREASYASVPPGTYQFRVRAANAAGVWNDTGAAITLVVAPPWWGTWWARVAMALLVVGLPVAAARVRLRAMRARSAWLEGRVEMQTRDLTAAQARIHEALEREREAARELLDITAAVPGAVFQLREDADGGRTFVFVSDGVAQLSDEAPGAAGMTPDDRCRVAERLLARIHPDDAGEVRRALTTSRDTLEPWRAEWRWITAGGAARWLAVQARPQRLADGATVWTGVATDATAARRADAERLVLETKMRQAQKAESLGVLAGGIAHDFNNLLVGVLANAELLREQVALDAEADETVSHIRTSALRAAELTQQLLAYAGKGRFVVERVALPQLVREMMALLRSAVPRTIDFELDADDPGPCVEGDATQLRQVVMNLVTNASEAIGDRAGRVAVRIGVETAAQRDLPLLHAAADMPAEGPYALVEVTDDGCGMDAALLTRIFDPFYSTKFTGRGLGLAALLGIVRAHHGGLHVESVPGRGARFRLYFPLAACNVAAPPPARAPRVSPAEGTRRPCVLLVDDEEAVRVAASRILRVIGYDVRVAADGAAALDAMAADGAVALVLMDVTMPVMDGPTCARALRARGVSAPIVLMSGYAEEELVARGVMAHADAFLAKPFMVEELEAVLREALARQAV